MTQIKSILATGFFSIFSSFAFSQSTPPLDKPVEKPPADQLSESGRIQEKNDARRNKMNSPDSDENHPTSKLHDRSFQQQNTYEKQKVDKLNAGSQLESDTKLPSKGN